MLESAMPEGEMEPGDPRALLTGDLNQPSR
jgi:hypothetical protein